MECVSQQREHPPYEVRAFIIPRSLQIKAEHNEHDEVGT